METVSPRWNETVRAPQFLKEERGEQVLAGVLLHVVQASRPVDAAFDRGAGEQWLRGEVPELALLVLFDVGDGGLQTRAAGGSGGEGAGVVRLASAGGVEGAAIERDLPQRRAAGARALADVGDGGGEVGECGVGVVEALGWHMAILVRHAPWARRRPGAELRGGPGVGLVFVTAGAWVGDAGGFG